MFRREIVLGWLACLIASAAPQLTHAGLADTIVKVRPSIVIVGTYRATDNPRFQLRGTGFVVGDGTRVVTNAHVLPAVTEVADSPSLVVQVSELNGQWQMRRVERLERNEVHDLALLQMEGSPLPALKLGDSSGVREGDDLAFTGFPIGGVLGFSPVTHRASVSSITTAALPSPSAKLLRERAVRGLRNGTFEVFQLDATAYPGNSGGPLFHPGTGEVVGVLNMVALKGTRESALSQPSGIAYAIPIKFVREMMERHR